MNGKKLKVLNLYAGIGGNRKLWTNVDVTAVEYNPEIAKIYNFYYPDDNVIVDDSKYYLVNNYKRFDFIWGSPPCQTHSRIRFASSKRGSYLPKIPDLGLYEIILFLKHYFGGKWVVENVIPFYEPLVAPTVKIGRHYFWSNFDIKNVDIIDRKSNKVSSGDVLYGYDLSNFKTSMRKDQILRNMFNPVLGKYILDEVLFAQLSNPKQKDVIKNESKKGKTI